MFIRMTLRLFMLELFVPVALILSGCAMSVHQPARLGLKLPPAALGSSISLQQHLIVERGGRIDQLDAALEVDPQGLNLVGLALGQRVLTLHYDGETLQSWRHSMLPAQLRDEDVLEDLQLTLWPVDAIRSALPPRWRIEESGQRRTLFIDDMPVMVIDYSGQPRWIGKIELSNLRYHYRLTIQSVSTGP
jgi:Protein of unknown function (DUF3261)